METQKEQRVVEEHSIELRVAAGSPAAKVAGAIVKYMQERYEVSLVAMGAGAVNQAVKAICIARGMAAPSGIDITTVPGFVTEDVGGELKTAIRFHLKT